MFAGGKGSGDEPVEGTASFAEYVIQDTGIPIIILSLDTLLNPCRNLLRRSNCKKYFDRFIRSHRYLVVLGHRAFRPEHSSGVDKLTNISELYQNFSETKNWINRIC